ncbi:antibiotic biosynthesis monooxygenase family protein [Mucilaginibacter sp. SP1R1]|jgi:heme-degrading monooxygenase HmoA|uniref:antibiotic biosynthesis monooxygenase family protein n=1 Tax=Mucilaginibacter sp. SP1R1 TaxID=2723091 RepID=UPI00161B0C25|nr:antibiotic biosynthesis monooxygenase [Mucilaginibacter sp. SP1R1]MBB6150967.1 heme-degrading monooxygenase HmoA [Mucilaginibacter sp. SP1R1]
MILEVAILNVIPGQQDAFVKAFSKAQAIISKMTGYISHQLKQCIENESRYILLVEWETLTDHTVGFRQSKEYQEWKALLHHFYDPFPTVEHYKDTEIAGAASPSVSYQTSQI